MPTPEEIRQLDGPALTRLAYDLEMDPLHPTLGWREYSPRTWRDGTTTYHSTTGDEWNPYRNVVQAEAVVRAVRARGYITDVYAGADFGRVTIRPSVQAFPGTTPGDTIVTLWGEGEPGTPAEATEALALLRCAVLAVASKQPSVDNGD